MLTPSSCVTLAAVRCRITPITLFTVGSCEPETNLGIDGNRTSGSMPPAFTLVLGGMTVFNPVCGRPARWRTRSSSRRTSPHGTARTTTFQGPPKLNCQHSSRSDEFDTRNFSRKPGLPGRAKMSCQFAIRTGTASGVSRHNRTNYSVVKCHLAPADSVVIVIWHRLTASAGCDAE